MRLGRQIGLVFVLLLGVALGLGLVARDRLPPDLLRLVGLAAPGEEGGAPGGSSGGPGGGGPPKGGRVLPVTVASVETRVIAEEIEALGTTRAHRAVAVVPLADGRIVSLPFEPGTRVAEGAVLARLDDETQRADVDEAEAALLEVSQSLERARRLRRGNTVTQATLEQLESERAAALARLDRARKALAERVIRAPFAGTVGFRELDVGARVSEGEILTTLDDLSTLDLLFQVPEQHYGAVRPGLAVAATSPAFPDRRFAGQVTWVDPRIDEASRAFRVRASLPNPDRTLPAGLFMTILLALDSREAPVVPERAVLSQGGGAAVFVVTEDGRAERRVIQLGRRLVDAVEVREGLAPGEVVVSAGIHRLRDGIAVKPVTGEGGDKP